MFYSHKTRVIDHNLTYLHSQKVFTGQYWDEFALTCSLVPDDAHVLMLGLSLGGGIRPLLSSQKKIKLTCIDYDKESVSKCQELYKEYFPEIKFKSLAAEAKEFLKHDDKMYDAIWFDIYESAAYSSLAFDTEFMNLIRSRLVPNGVMLVNSYGLPNHFSPLVTDGIQQKLTSFLQSQFGFVATIPFRRNMTFVVSTTKPRIYSAEVNEALNPMDRFTFDFVKQKIATLTSFDKLVNRVDVDNNQAQFATIDVQMRHCWSDLRQRLNSAGFEIKENSEFVSLIQNQELCEKVIHQLIQNNDLAVCFVPILASGESHMRELQIDWLFDWTEQNQDLLLNSLNENFKLIWMTQLWALIIHPHGRYKKYYFKYLALMQKDPIC